MRRSIFGVLVFAATIGAACSANPEAKADKLCTPDVTVFCRCKDASPGTKKCNSDGMSFEACLPCDGTGSEEDFGSDGLGNRDEEIDKSSTEEEGSTTFDGGGDRIQSAKQPDAGGGSTEESKRDEENDAVPNAWHCQPLENTAPRIELQRVADEPTKPAGGKAVDGVYVQSWVVEFTGEGGEEGPSKHFSKETLELRGKFGRYVFEDDEGTRRAGGFRLTRDQAHISVAYECPAAEPAELAYDAVGSTLIVYDPPLARVFIRQKVTK
ncbi:MAG TPA: hypothetical protein VM925_21210 [Labilithrix sp.]|nr:hypothetical protein [Labilithrix sp.]